MVFAGEKLQKLPAQFVSGQVDQPPQLGKHSPRIIHNLDCNVNESVCNAAYLQLAVKWRITNCPRGTGC
jgi:hypothetical protein